MVTDLNESASSSEESTNDSTTTSTDDATEIFNFKPQTYDVVFNDRGRTDTPGHTLMRSKICEYLSSKQFVKGKAEQMMNTDAPGLMEHIKKCAALRVRGKESRAPSMYKLETKKNGQVRYIKAKPTHLVTYVRQLRKNWRKEGKALDASTTPTASLISPSLATSSRAEALGNPFPPPPTPLTNSLAKLAGAYSCLLKIENLKNEDDKTQTELYVDFLSGLMVDGNTAFLEQIPKYGNPSPMLQCMYQGVQMTLEEMYKVYQEFETKEKRGTTHHSPLSSGSGRSSNPDGKPTNRKKKRKDDTLTTTVSRKHAKTGTTGNKDAASQKADKYHGKHNANFVASKPPDDVNNEDSGRNRGV
jgi:hypothetical protein